MDLAIIPLSSLQLVPVTRIEEFGDERGELNWPKEERFLKNSHGGQEIHGYGITSA